MTYGEACSATDAGTCSRPGSLGVGRKTGVLLNLQSRPQVSLSSRACVPTDGRRFGCVLDRRAPRHATPAGTPRSDGAVNGHLIAALSAEVQVHEDRRDSDGRRLIERATLAGAAIVDRAAFESTAVTVHGAQPRRRRVWL